MKETKRIYDFKIPFSERLEKLRKSFDFTQKELADKIGVNRKMIVEYEDIIKSAMPRTDKLIALSNVFGVSIDYLLGKSKYPKYDIDIRAISDYTGLNEKSISQLHSCLIERAGIPALDDADFLDAFLELFTGQEYQECLSKIWDAHGIMQLYEMKDNRIGVKEDVIRVNGLKYYLLKKYEELLDNDIEARVSRMEEISGRRN